MKLKFLIAFLGLSACANVQSAVEPPLVPLAEAVLSTEKSSQPETFFVPAQPDPYAKILSSNYDELSFGFDNNLRSLEISRLSGRQSRLPQIRPGAQASANGNLEIGVEVRQLLFDGGVSRAQYQSDDHAAVLRQVELLQDLNRQSSQEISVFLSYQQNLETEVLLTRLSRHIEGLLNLAETRVKGGVGTESDVSLFALRLYEIETDAKIARANAQADLAALNTEVKQTEPVEFTFRKSHLPLSVVAAIADLQNARSSLNLAKKERNPQLVLDGRAGLDPLTGLPTSNVGLAVETETISIGGNVAVKRAEEEVRLAEHNLEREVRLAERETTRLRGRLDALKAQLEQTKQLSERAHNRFASFSSQFQAGTSQLTEAAGLVQTMRSSLESVTVLKFEILNLQRQLAEQGGHFWGIPE